MRLATLCLLPLLVACHVSRVPEERTGPADLPSLRRATTALKELIQLEKQHVAHFNAELRSTREEERRKAFELEEAEEYYQQLLKDLDGIDSDIRGLTSELDEARQVRQRLADDLGSLRGEVASSEAELEALRANLERSRTELAELQASIQTSARERVEVEAAAADARQQLDEVRRQLADTLEALERSRDAEAGLGRDLLVQLLIGRLRHDQAGRWPRVDAVTALAPSGAESATPGAGAASDEVSGMPPEPDEGDGSAGEPDGGVGEAADPMTGDADPAAPGEGDDDGLDG